MLPSSELSKNQINRLGDRLRTTDISELDLRLLDNYRRSFTDAYEDVVGRIRDQLGLEPTGRPAKSTPSIIEKLRRERTRLSRMQDIAGCRVIVPDLLTQDEAVENLKNLFDKFTIVDRRERPSHGYRAVHVIIVRHGKLIEVQVRTSLQHAWAQLSEKLSDEVDNAIKYGGGDEDLVSLLAVMSNASMDMEIAIKTKDGHRMATEIQRWPDLFERLRKIISRLKGQKDDIFN
jgi:putative GTP pyrophosphokinase